jgi:hypothetical protein
MIFVILKFGKLIINISNVNIIYDKRYGKRRDKEAGGIRSLILSKRLPLMVKAVQISYPSLTVRFG